MHADSDPAPGARSNPSPRIRWGWSGEALLGLGPLEVGLQERNHLRPLPGRTKARQLVDDGLPVLVLLIKHIRG